MEQHHSRLRQVEEAEIQRLEGEGEEPQLQVAGVEEQGFLKIAVAVAVGRPPLVGSTDSRPHSSGSHHKRHRGLKIHSTEHTVRCSLLHSMSRGFHDRQGWRWHPGTDGDGCSPHILHRRLHHGSGLRDLHGHRGGRTRRSRVEEDCP